MRSGLPAAQRCAPDMGCAHRAAELHELLLHEGDLFLLVRAVPVIGDAWCGQAPGVLYVRIEVDGVIRVRKVLRLRQQHQMAREIFREEIAIGGTPSRRAWRRDEPKRARDRAAL